MMHLKVIFCEWIDSTTSVGWEDGAKEKLDTCYSVGILISENKESVCIASSYDHDTGENNGRIYIPLTAIKRIRTLCQIQMKTKT